MHPTNNLVSPPPPHAIHPTGNLVSPPPPMPYTPQATFLRGAAADFRTNTALAQELQSLSEEELMQRAKRNGLSREVRMDGGDETCSTCRECGMPVVSIRVCLESTRFMLLLPSGRHRCHHWAFFAFGLLSTW